MAITLEPLTLPVKVDDSAFKSALGALSIGVAAAVAAMGAMVKVTFDWANELDSLGDVMGGTNEQVAALNFVARKSGVGVDKLKQGLTILEKGLVKADGTLDVTGKKMKDWGINVFDANGKLKDQTTLINDVSKKYASFSTQQERVNFLTETFGKSGAELVDFFDTLAKEGGIDKVTEKVKAYGLAIDPGRYEQFNRNLEELKLIGTGLAVQFTEKLMPVLEKFLGWFTDFAKSPDIPKLLGQLDEFGFEVISGMSNSIQDWIKSDGPQKLSDDIISWVEDIGKGEGFNSKAATAAGNLLSGLVTAISSVDWIGITDAIDGKIADAINNYDWTASGQSFGNTVSATMSMGLSTGMETKKSEAVPAIGNALNEWILGAIDAASWGEYGARVNANFSRLFAAGSETWPSDAIIRDALTKLFIGGFETALPGITTKANQTGQGIITSVTLGFLQNQPAFIAALTAFDHLSDSKLREISKTFFNAAGRWVSQAARGFTDHIGELLSVISGIVGQINSILKGIHFPSFSIGGLNFGGGSAQTSNTGGGGGGGGGASLNRASGGPVIAGQSYTVGELKAEKFTPIQSGRIDQISQLKEVSLSNDTIDKLAEKLGLIIPINTIKAMNSR